MFEGKATTEVIGAVYSAEAHSVDKTENLIYNLPVVKIKTISFVDS